MVMSPELEEIAQDRFAFISDKARQGDVNSAALVDEYNIGLSALARNASSSDISSMPWLPQLPETWAQELHDRIEAAERKYAAPNLHSDDYELGTATQPDDIAVVSGEIDRGWLFTAEHGTEPVRFATKKREMADVGTAGLAAVLAEDFGNALIMNGDQKSNAPIDPNHRIKGYIRDYVPEMKGFASVHGMAGGKFISPTDRTEIQAILGLGANPSEEQRDYAEKLVKQGRDLGLYVIIGNDTPFYVQKPGSHELKPKKTTGNLLYEPLAAERETSTTNFVRSLQPDVEKPAFQIELTRFLRLTPYETDKRDRVSRVIGVALGYKLLQSAVELVQS